MAGDGDKWSMARRRGPHPRKRHDHFVVITGTCPRSSCGDGLHEADIILPLPPLRSTGDLHVQSQVPPFSTSFNLFRHFLTLFDPHM